MSARVTALALLLATAEAQPPDVPNAVDVRPAAAEADRNDALRGMRNALMRAGDYSAALEPARELVGGFAEGDAGAALDLLALAAVELELDDAATAEARVLLAIDLLGAQESERARELIDAYRLLGDIHLREQRPLEAVGALEQAREISRRNLGLFNLEQMALLDRLTAVYLGVGETRMARQLQEQKVETAERRFGPDTLETVPYRSDLANYYSRSRLRQAARNQYERVLAIQEAALGSDDPALLPALRALLESDLLTGTTSDARERIAAILSAPSAPLDPLEHGRALAALGDWEAATTSIAAGREYYVQAHQAITQGSIELADEFFAAPVAIDFVPPLSPVDRGTRRRTGYAWGTIVLGFDLDAGGRPSAIRVVSAAPAGIVDDAYVTRLAQTHFRPRLVNGQPAPTRDTRLTHSFRYYVEDEDGSSPTEAPDE